jgi:hypothetical protein
MEFRLTLKFGVVKMVLSGCKKNQGAGKYGKHYNHFAPQIEGYGSVQMKS